jgi:CHAT domain
MKKYFLLALLCLSLSALSWAETPEETRAKELIQATALSQQLGDHVYTSRRLPEFEQAMNSIDARVLEIERKAEKIRASGADVEALGEKIRRDGESGTLNFDDLSSLLKGTTTIAQDASELGAEGAKIGAESALIGLQASRVGLAGAEVVSYTRFGLPSSALLQLQTREGKSKSTVLSLAKMRAAQASGQSDLAWKYSEAVPQDSPISRYISITTRHQARPDGGLAGHLASREQAGRLLGQIEYSAEIAPDEWRWASECQSYWLKNGAQFTELSVEELAHEELENWERLDTSAQGLSYELMLGVPELFFQQALLGLERGDLSLARSWRERGAEKVERAQRSLQSAAGSMNQKYPGLRVSDAPRILILQGLAAEVKGRIALQDGQAPTSDFQQAQSFYQKADAPVSEIALLIDWPSLDSGQNKRLGDVSARVNHALGQLVAKLNRAQLAYESGQEGEARVILAQLLPQIREQIAQVGVTPTEQHQYARAFSLNAKLEAKDGRAAAALASLTEREQMNTSAGLGSSAQAADVAPVQKKRARLRALQQEQSAEKALPAEASRPADSGALIASNKQEFVGTARDLREKHPEYSSLLFVDPVEFSKLQVKIPPGTVVLQYFPTTDGTLYIFAVSEKSYSIRTVAVASEELARLVRLYRSIVGRFPPPPISWKDDGTRAHDYAKVFYQLHELLISPVEEEIAGAKTVAIIPSGHLHYLPFAGLARPAESGPEFLIQRKQVVVLSKASDLALLDGTPKTAGNLAAFGNPDGSLPGAAKEVAEIKEVFPSSSVALGASATKERLRSESAQAKYLHLATHGTLNNRNPNASFITMAGAAEGGRLHPSEIFELPLSGARLVTISACSTALGRANPGAEVTSLAEAFWVAGAPSVVASLWKVSDDSTRELMVDFYGHLKSGATLAESLQAAQIKQLGGEYSHPGFWAPFVLLGDWR